MNTMAQVKIERYKAEESPIYQSGVYNIDIGCIHSSPMQARSFIDDADIVALADSIRQFGLVSPIVIREKSTSYSGERSYEIVAGERRFRAFKMLGRSHIPSIILDATDEESAKLAIVENLMRKNLNMFEYSRSLKYILSSFSITQEELAAKMSTSQSNIANKLRLLTFTNEEQQIILEKALTERHARALLRIKDPNLRFSTLKKIVDASMNVEECELYVDKIIQPKNISQEGAIKELIEAIKEKSSDISSDAEIKKTETESYTKIVIFLPK